MSIHKNTSDNIFFFLLDNHSKSRRRSFYSTKIIVRILIVPFILWMVWLLFPIHHSSLYGSLPYFTFHTFSHWQWSIFLCFIYAGFCHVTCFGHWNINKNDCNSSKSRLIAALPIDAYAFCISVTASRKTYPGWPNGRRRIRNMEQSSSLQFGTSLTKPAAYSANFQLTNWHKAMNKWVLDIINFKVDCYMALLWQ